MLVKHQYQEPPVGGRLACRITSPGSAVECNKRHEIRISWGLAIATNPDQNVLHIQSLGALLPIVVPMPPPGLICPRINTPALPPLWC